MDLFPPPLPGDVGTPLQLFWDCLAFRHHLWGWSQHDGGAGWGKSLPRAWQGRAAPGSPHPAHPARGVLGCGRELPASYPPASSLRLPPPSPPALLQEEIQQLKSKLEKVEKERNELRLNSDRLESRVGP